MGSHIITDAIKSYKNEALFEVSENDNNKHKLHSKVRQKP
jgi:hypothetical protein